MSKKPNGDFYNPGLEAAQQAALAVNGFVACPEFAKDAPGNPTDWNDYAAIHGLDAVKEKLMAAILSIETPKAIGHDLITLEDMEAMRPPDHLYEEMAREIPPEYATEYDPAPKANRVAIKSIPVWPMDKIKAAMVKRPDSKDGKPGAIEPNSSHNVLTYLRHHEELNGVFRLDVFSGKIIIHRSPPWENPKGFKVREQDDSDITLLKAWFEKNTKMMPRDNLIYSAAYVVAKECFIDPPLDYMEGLTWDQEPRLHKLFTHYFQATKQPKELLEALAKKWMIGGVARQYRPGCKLDNIIVLEGKGGSQKSTSLEILATFSGEKYFSDGLDFRDLKNKDTIAISRGKIILEFQELAGMGQSGMDGIIKWLTIKADECRVPYARTPQKFDRRFLLAGTTNDGELPYHGGIRRFWSIVCGEQIDCDALARDATQLWAEAVHLFKAGEKWWIPHDDPIRLLVENEQRIRVYERALTQPVLDYIGDMKPSQITASKIISGIGITNSQRTRDTIREVNAIMKDAGWIKITARIDGRVSKGWQNPDKKVIDAEWTEEQEEIKWG